MSLDFGGIDPLIKSEQDKRSSVAKGLVPGLLSSQYDLIRTIIILGPLDNK